MHSPSALYVEALGIVDDLELIDLLACWGQVELVGSVALDLIVKRDIDLHLLVKGDVAAQGLRPIAGAIREALQRRIRLGQTHIHDYSTQGGLKVGVEALPGASGDWTIDIWVTDRVETTAFARRQELAAALTPAQREAILRIKRGLIAQGRYPAGTGPRIYEAVLHHGITSRRAFVAHVESVSAECNQLPE